MKSLQSVKEEEPEFKSLAEPSLKEKYEDLLEDKLPLPVHFKIVCNQQSDLDHILTMFYSRKKRRQFEDIKKAMEATSRREFSLDAFKKILAVKADFYVYSWERS